jgi:hypothetical protein
LIFAKPGISATDVSLILDRQSAANIRSRSSLGPTLEKINGIY